MGLLQKGKWVDQWYDTKTTKGHFKRTVSQFRHRISKNDETFPAEKNRYHLYISYACPWAHRTLIFRKIKGLEKMISFSSVHWFMGDQGWTFASSPGQVDEINGRRFLHEIYTQVEDVYSGRVTVPLLWDKKTNRIVSNESSEIIRMFNSAFDHLGATPGDYYPVELREEIDALNDRIYTTFNNGVYKTGFATTQRAYEASLIPLFETLDFLEEILANQRYLMGANLTEADWRFFPTLVRFDPVYVGHFKCNLKRICDYPNLSNYLRDLYQHEGIASTINMEDTKKHYYASHSSVNPNGIVPLGPDIDLGAPHDRARLD